MTDGVGANGADGGNGITQRSRETEVEQRTVFSVCVSVAPFLCVIPLPPCSPFTHARELEQYPSRAQRHRDRRRPTQPAHSRGEFRMCTASSARSRRGQSPAEIQPKSRVFGLGCTNRECSLRRGRCQPPTSDSDLPVGADR